MHQSKGERNYHIFYYLCEGAPASLRGQLTLRDADHAYLGGTMPAESQNSAESFEARASLLIESPPHTPPSAQALRGALALHTRASHTPSALPRPRRY